MIHQKVSKYCDHDCSLHDMTEKRKIAQTANRLDYSISMTKC